MRKGGWGGNSEAVEEEREGEGMSHLQEPHTVRLFYAFIQGKSHSSIYYYSQCMRGEPFCAILAMQNSCIVYETTGNVDAEMEMRQLLVEVCVCICIHMQLVWHIEHSVYSVSMYVCMIESVIKMVRLNFFLKAMRNHIAAKDTISNWKQRVYYCRRRGLLVSDNDLGEDCTLLMAQYHLGRRALECKRFICLCLKAHAIY